MKSDEVSRYSERNSIGILNEYLNSADEQIEEIPEYVITSEERRVIMQIF